MSRMEPAIRDYLTKMREEAFIDIKPGYTDTGASPNETKPVLQRLYAARAQEEGEGGAHPLPRDHAHLPAEVAAGSGCRLHRPPRRRPWSRPARSRRRSTARAPSRPSRSRARRKRSASARSRAKRCPPSPTAQSRTRARFLRRPQLPRSRSIRWSPLRQSKKTRFSARAKVAEAAEANRVRSLTRWLPRAGCRRGCRPRNAGRSVGLAGDTATKKKKKATTEERKDPPGRTGRRSLTTSKPQSAVHAGAPGAGSACSRALRTRALLPLPRRSNSPFESADAAGLGFNPRPAWFLAIVAAEIRLYSLCHRSSNGYDWRWCAGTRRRA